MRAGALAILMVLGWVIPAHAICESDCHNLCKLNAARLGWTAEQCIQYQGCAKFAGGQCGGCPRSRNAPRPARFPDASIYVALKRGGPPGRGHEHQCLVRRRLSAALSAIARHPHSLVNRPSRRMSRSRRIGNRAFAPQSPRAACLTSGPDASMPARAALKPTRRRLRTPGADRFAGVRHDLLGRPRIAGPGLRRVRCRNCGSDWFDVPAVRNGNTAVSRRSRGGGRLPP